MQLNHWSMRNRRYALMKQNLPMDGKSCQQHFQQVCCQEIFKFQQMSIKQETTASKICLQVCGHQEKRIIIVRLFTKLIIPIPHQRCRCCLIQDVTTVSSSISSINFILIRRLSQRRLSSMTIRSTVIRPALFVHCK